MPWTERRLPRKKAPAPKLTPSSEFSYNEQSCVSTSKGEAFRPTNTVPAVEYSGSIMLWGCFAASEPGALNKVDGKMKKEDSAGQPQPSAGQFKELDVPAGQ